MNTEEKAKAYDEALKRAGEWHNDPHITIGIKGNLEDIFPELRGGKEERTINCIGMCLTDANEQRFKDYGTTLKDCLAWLKKQGKSDKIVEKAKIEKQRVLVTESDGSANIDWDTRSLKDARRLLECGLQYINTELEKQGEHKLTDKIEPKFHEGEWITNGDYTWKIVEVKPLDYILQSQEGNIVDDTISHVDEQFHSFTIKDAKDGDVLACPLPKGCESGEQIFIFKGINSRDYVDNCIEYYCRICDGVFYVNENGYMGTTSSPLYPATKEQRDAHFAKMKEAGYEWDTEKKELKKISQRMVSAEAKEALYDKPVWSEEDEEALEVAIIALEDMYSEDSPLDCYAGHYMPFDRVAKQLKAIKDRVVPQPNQELSEEDEEYINDLIGVFDGQQHQAHSDEEVVNWLKSIRLQYNKEWGKSDEEMLKSIISTCELACEDRDSSPARHLLEMQTNWLKSLKQRIVGNV